MFSQWDRGVGQGSENFGPALSLSRAPPMMEECIMQLTPIFDQLVEEFTAKDIHILGLYEMTPATISVESVQEGISFLANLGEVLAQDEPEDEPTVVMDAITEHLMNGNLKTADEMREGAGVTHKTLYDATHLAVIKPAIPPMGVKMEDMRVTPEMHAILKAGSKSVTETLKQADEELGLDTFDEAFEVAAKLLERPKGYIKVDQIVNQEQLKEKVEEAIEKGAVTSVGPLKPLPKRKNNRNKNRNRSGRSANKTANDPHFSFFQDDVPSSPGSAT